MDQNEECQMLKKNLCTTWRWDFIEKKTKAMMNIGIIATYWQRYGIKVHLYCFKKKQHFTTVKEYLKKVIPTLFQNEKKKAKVERWQACSPSTKQESEVSVDPILLLSFLYFLITVYFCSNLETLDAIIFSQIFSPLSFQKMWWMFS